MQPHHVETNKMPSLNYDWIASPVYSIPRHTHTYTLFMLWISNAIIPGCDTVSPSLSLCPAPALIWLWGRNIGQLHGLTRGRSSLQPRWSIFVSTGLFLLLWGRLLHMWAHQWVCSVHEYCSLELEKWDHLSHLWQQLKNLWVFNYRNKRFEDITFSSG